MPGRKSGHFLLREKRYGEIVGTLIGCNDLYIMLIIMRELE